MIGIRHPPPCKLAVESDLGLSREGGTFGMFLERLCWCALVTCLSGRFSNGTLCRGSIVCNNQCLATSHVRAENVPKFFSIH